MERGKNISKTSAREFRYRSGYFIFTLFVREPKTQTAYLQIELMSLSLFAIHVGFK